MLVKVGKHYEFELEKKMFVKQDLIFIAEEKERKRQLKWYPLLIAKKQPVVGKVFSLIYLRNMDLVHEVVSLLL